MVEQSETKISVCNFIKTNKECKNYKREENNWLIMIPEEFYLDDSTNATVAWGKLYHKSILKQIRYPQGRFFEDSFTTHKLLFSEKSRYNKERVILLL